MPQSFDRLAAVGTIVDEIRQAAGPLAGSLDPQVLRAGAAAGAAVDTVAIELLEEPQTDWFSYGSRRGMKF